MPNLALLSRLIGFGAPHHTSPSKSRCRLPKPLDRSSAIGQSHGVVGAVDGIVHNELCGWIADFDNPGHLETVGCRSRSGLQLFFRACFRRDDICEKFGSEGIFGFAIPVDLLTEVGPRISVLDRLGRPLTHGKTVVLPRSVQTSTDKKASPARLFMHIPKTAGTSVRLALKSELTPGEAISLYPDHHVGISQENFLALPSSQRSRFRSIFGHFYFGLHQHLEATARYITFVRDPIARLRSNFAHHAAAGTVFLENGEVVRPSTVINEGLSDEFDNIMTRMIAGVATDAVARGQIDEDHVDRALCNVQAHFSFVGHQDRLAADLGTLLAGLGKPLVVPSRLNVTPEARLYDETEIAAVDWKHVIDRNRFDVMLLAQLERSGLTSRILEG